MSWMAIYLLLFTKMTQELEVVVNWGQNLGQNEMPLNVYCDSKAYDVIIINTVDIFFDDQNSDNLPGLNFANHCVDVFEGNFKSYLRCSAIGEAIKACQKNGKKILLSLGGGTRWNGFSSILQAKLFASNLWNLFMGGVHPTRSFGDAVIDGINIDLRFGEASWFNEFFTEMRELMGTDKNKVYFITSTPSCAFPDYRMGKIYESSGDKINSLYVYFGDNSCYYGKEEEFSRILDLWLNLVPSIYIGIPSAPTASYSLNHYIEPSKISILFSKYIQLNKHIGGILLSDVTYDDKNIINGTKYSDYVGNVLHPNAYKLQNHSAGYVPAGSLGNKSSNKPDSATTYVGEVIIIVASSLVCFLLR